MTAMIGMCGNGYGADAAAMFMNYQAIVNNETNAPAAIEKGKQYLVSLSHADFMAFIRETRRHAEYDRDDSDAVLAMVFFAKWYKEGPGKDESMLTTLKQISDLTLPTSWKIGLLDVLKPEKRIDMSEEEVFSVIAVLDETGMSKQSSDVLRFFCLQKLGGILYTQRDIMIQKTPNLKDALEKQDRTVLPKQVDADVKRAGNLIDAIRNYRTMLLKAADEVKDDKIRNNLKKRLVKWEPTSVMPTTPTD
ncbi:MAG: hypothetical protein WCO26_15715 [Deltaproteobacteria bacterium]